MALFKDTSLSWCAFLLARSSPDQVQKRQFIQWDLVISHLELGNLPPWIQTSECAPRTLYPPPQHWEYSRQRSHARFMPGCSWPHAYTASTFSHSHFSSSLSIAFNPPSAFNSLYMTPLPCPSTLKLAFCLLHWHSLSAQSYEDWDLHNTGEQKTDCKVITSFWLSTWKSSLPSFPQKSQ